MKKIVYIQRFFFGEIVRKHFVKSKIESGTIKLDISGTKEDFSFFLVLGYTYIHSLLYINVDRYAQPMVYKIYTKVYKRGRGEVDYIRIKCRLLYISF